VCVRAAEAHRIKAEREKKKLVQFLNVFFPSQTKIRDKSELIFDDDARYIIHGITIMPLEYAAAVAAAVKPLAHTLTD